jgi:hypothetical protein
MYPGRFPQPVRFRNELAGSGGVVILFFRCLRDRKTEVETTTEKANSRDEELTKQESDSFLL